MNRIISWLQLLYATRCGHFYTTYYMSKVRKFWSTSGLCYTIFGPFSIRKVLGNFCLRINYSFKLLSRIRHISHIFWHLPFKTKKLRPGRTGADIDPLTGIPTVELPLLDLVTFNTDLAKEFEIEISNSARVSRIVSHVEENLTNKFEVAQKAIIRGGRKERGSKIESTN